MAVQRQWSAVKNLSTSMGLKVIFHTFSLSLFSSLSVEQCRFLQLTALLIWWSCSTSGLDRRHGDGHRPAEHLCGKKLLEDGGIRHDTAGRRAAISKDWLVCQLAV